MDARRSRGEEDVMASGRAADRVDPSNSRRNAARSLDRDLRLVSTAHFVDRFPTVMPANAGIYDFDAARKIRSHA